jgi:ribokinase
MPRVVVLGASTTDMNLRFPTLPRPGQTLLGGDFFTGPGGKGANQAVASARAGAEVVFLTAFGDDDFGRAVRDHDRAEGIDLAHAKVVAGQPTGVALIFVADDGENLIGVAMGANAHLLPEDIDALPDEVFQSGGVFLASLEVPIETVVRAVRRARRAGMMVVVNPAPADLQLARLGALSEVDILTPNCSEAETLTGHRLAEGDDPSSLIAPLLESGVGSVVLTLGGAGCLVADAAGTTHLPAHAVRVVDTVGAGDAFNGALAAALAEGRPVREAAAWATRAGAIAVTKPGAQGALPTRAEIDALGDPHPSPHSEAL